jgi:predicted transcriptional regulator YdeE
MKHEIVELYDMQIIGMSKKIAFNEAKEECPKFWGEFVEKIIKPVIFEKQEPEAFRMWMASPMPMVPILFLC